MRLFPYLIPVSNIVSSIPSRFSPDQLRQAAQLILGGDGIINPLIVRRIDFDRYELVDGIFEYQAAVEAKKLDPTRGGLINAYIIQPGEHIIAEQVAMFRRSAKSELVPATDAQASTPITELMREFEALLRTQEGRFEVVLKKAMEAAKVQLSQQSLGVEAKVGANQSVAGIETGETKPLSSQLEPQLRVSDEKISSSPSDSEQAAASEEAAFMNFLNRTSQRELQDLRSRVPHKAISLLLSQRNKRLFESQEDCLSRVRGKGFADASYVRIFEMWKEKLAATGSDSRSGSRSYRSSNTVTAASLLAKKPVGRSQTASPNVTDVQSVMHLPIAVALPPTVEPVKSSLSGIDKLNNMDARELTLTLHRMRLSQKLIDALLRQRPFSSFDNINIQGLGTSKKEKLKAAFV